MKNIENIVNTEVRSIEDLILENEALMARNEFLEKAISVLKRDNERTTIERNKLVDEIQRITSMGMFEFGNKYCSDESLREDGRAFARSLLGKPMTDSDYAEERFMENGVKAYEASLRLGDDF